mmetsp:Transcript_5267/g.11254  ORF Transcript_5267/g.11254 Transcript_5267/m.11254 type:complete len:672 (-) Transcript_5267:99-2114(-)
MSSPSMPPGARASLVAPGPPRRPQPKGLPPRMNYNSIPTPGMRPVPPQPSNRPSYGPPVGHLPPGVIPNGPIPRDPPQLSATPPKMVLQRVPPPRGPPPRGPPPIPPRGQPPTSTIRMGQPIVQPPGQYLGRSSFNQGLSPLDPPIASLSPASPNPNQPSLLPPKIPLLDTARKKNVTPNSITMSSQPDVSELNKPNHSKPLPLGKPPPHILSHEPNIRPQQQHPFGKLVVTIIRGVNLKAGQGVFGRADPYVRVKIGDKALFTNPHKSGGKNPEWNEEFEFEMTTEKELEIEVLDKEVIGSDKFMGFARVNILDWVAQGEYQGAIELLDQSNRNAGRLAVNAAFYRHGMYPEKNSGSTHANAIGSPKATNENEKETSPEDEFTEKEIAEAFRSFDLDKNTYVGAAEIKHVLLSIGERPTDEEVDEMIRMADKNGDGQVAFDEFYRMITGGRDPPAGLGSAVRQSIMGAESNNLEGLANGVVGSSKKAPQKLLSGPDVVKARKDKRKALDEFARDNFLKLESIKLAHRRFQRVDKKKSGVMDYTEFCEVLQVEPSVQCEAVFKMYDNNNSGLIDAKELMIALNNFTGASKDDKMKFAFMLYDEEDTGSMTHQELVKILRANHMARSEAEVSRKAETIISQCDKGNDGVITFDEFVVVSKKFPNILFPSQKD